MSERGTAAMVGEAGREARAAIDAQPVDEQLDLLGFADPRAVVPDQHGGYGQAVAKWRANGCKGRKPGALNRASSDLRDYLLQHGPHPLVAMMQLQARPAGLLAAELGCKPIEAAELQQKARAELAPYIEGKKPVAVEFTGQAAMYVIPGMPDLDGRIVAAPLPGAGTLPGAIEAAAVPFFVERDESGENQQLGDTGEGRSK